MLIGRGAVTRFPPEDPAHPMSSPTTEPTRPTADTVNTLATRIRTARQDADMTVSDVARRLGVNPATVQKWESGRSEPRSNKLILLAGILGASPVALLSGEEDATAAAAPEDAGLDPRNVAMLRAQLVELQDQTARISHKIGTLLGRLP